MVPMRGTADFILFFLKFSLLLLRLRLGLYLDVAIALIISLIIMSVEGPYKDSKT